MTDPRPTPEEVLDRLAQEHPDFVRQEEAVRLLGLYVTELAEWGRRMHLTGKGDPAGTIAAQVGDSLAMLLCAEDALGKTPGESRARIEVLDIGSGAGFPGLVWKIARPFWRVTLVERRERAAAFLRRTAAVVGLGDLEILEQDASRLAPAARDVIVSKAAGDYPRLLPLVRRLARPGALYVTAKGTGWRRELERSEAHDFLPAAVREIAPGRGEAVALRYLPGEGGVSRETPGGQ